MLAKFNYLKSLARFVLGAAKLSVKTATKGQRTEKLSVVFLNWKREDLLRKIILQYQAYEFIDDIIVWNNSSIPFIAPSDKIRVINCSFDHGLDSRFAACLLCKNDHVLLHDDDLIVPKLSLSYIFNEYLSDSSIIHGLIGRNLYNQYNKISVYGDVDIVLTRAIIFNRQYVKDYFACIERFDSLRKYSCGNGEDIIMNYVVRALTGRKNKAHAVIFIDFGGSKEISKHALHNLEYHYETRNEIAQKAEQFLKDAHLVFDWNQELLTKLSAKFPVARWFNEFHDLKFPEMANYKYSDHIHDTDLKETLDLLKRK